MEGEKRRMEMEREEMWTRVGNALEMWRGERDENLRIRMEKEGIEG